MKKSLLIYWQKECEYLIEDVQAQLKLMFGLEAVAAQQLEPPVSAFDTYRQQYDVRYLIDILGTECCSLWLLNVDISDPTHLYLYGVASEQAALVSTYRTGSEANLFKEVCHEVGHLLGLDHCRNQCLMHTSRDIRQLNNKPLTLCSKCSQKLHKSRMLGDRAAIVF